MADERKQDEPGPPPGHFISDDLRMETARFLDEVKKRLERERSRQEPKLGPPRRRR